MSNHQEPVENGQGAALDASPFQQPPPPPPPMEDSYKQLTIKRMKLKSTQYRFKRACDQIVFLNRRMESVLQRYYKARSEVNRTFRYKLRLRLAVVEGIRNMYYDYANQRASEIVVLRRDLFGEIVEIVSDNHDRGHDTDEVDTADSDADTTDGSLSFDDSPGMEQDWSP